MSKEFFGLLQTAKRSVEPIFLFYHLNLEPGDVFNISISFLIFTSFHMDTYTSGDLSFPFVKVHNQNFNGVEKDLYIF